MYQVHLVCKGGSDVSTENIDASFIGISVGTHETSETLDDLALKYGTNPFSSDINLSYNLNEKYDMIVNIYNSLGQIV